MPRQKLDSGPIREEFLAKDPAPASGPAKTKFKITAEGGPHLSSIDMLESEIGRQCPGLRKSAGTAGTAFNFYTLDDAIVIGVYKNGEIWTDLQRLGDDRASRLRRALSPLNIDLPFDKKWSNWKRGDNNLSVDELDPVAIAGAIRQALQQVS
jgi:hypothetical protein